MQRNIRKQIGAMGIVAAALAAAPAARGSLLASDNFRGDTPGANLASAPATEGTGGSDPFSGSWSLNTSSDALTTPSKVMNSPGSPESATSIVAQAPGAFADAQRYLASPVSTAAGTMVFASFLINGSDVSGTANADLLSLSGSSADSFVVQIGTGFNSGSSDWGFAVTNTATNSAASFQPVPGATISANQTYLLVVELSYSGGTTDSVTMWVDPTSTKELAHINFPDFIV